MNSGRRVFSWALGGVMLIALASAQAQPSAARGRPILFSDPKRDSATTNLNQATKKMALQSVEDGLKQMNILDLADPTRHEATIPPPHVPPPNFNSRQGKGLLDKKDWAFRTQEDFEAQYNSKVEQMFKVGEYGPDGKRTRDQSAMERYYDRMEAGRTRTNSLAKEDSRFDDKKEAKDDRFNSKDDKKKSERSSDFSTSAELKRLTGESMREAMEKDGGKPRTIADIFGINDANSPASLREQRQQELQLEKFRKILDPSFVPSTSGAGNLFGGTGPAAVPVATKPLGTLPGSPSAFGSLPSLSGGALQPQGLPELPRAPDLNTPQPKLETPPPAAQPTPAFALPKRKF